MGNKLSLTDEDVQQITKQTHFSKDQVERLFTRFQKIDADGSGTITKDELLDLGDLAMNPLLDRFISIFDVDSNKNIDFVEFVTALSVFSESSNREEKLQFAFKVYDIDADGYIGNGELFQVLKMMVGENLNDVQLQQICDKSMIEADLDKDGKLSYEEFCQIVQDIDLEQKLTIEF